MRIRLFCYVLCAFFLLGTRAEGQIRIATNIDTVVFSNVKLGYSRDAIVDVQNISAFNVVIKSVTITTQNAYPNEFSIISPIPTTFTLIPTEHRNILLRLKPQEDNVRNALLTIVTDEGTKEVQLIGLVTNSQPDVITVPKVIDFGAHVFGDIVDTTYYIIGAGVDSATISGFNIANDNAGIYFQAYPKDPTITFPYLLGPNDTLVMTAHYESTIPLGDRTGHADAYGDVTLGTRCDFLALVAMPEGKFTQDIVDIGLVPIGTIIDTAVYLKSTANIPLNVQSFLPMIAFQPSYPSTPNVIKGGDSIRIPVRFAATANGKYEEALGIFAKETASGGKYRQVLMRAYVAPIVIQSTHNNSIDISCGIDSTYTEHFVIRDTGNSSILISKILIADSSFSTVLSGGLPRTLNPGESLDFDLLYHHQGGASGVSTAIIEYLTSDYTILRDTIEFISHQDSLPFTMELHRSTLDTNNDIVEVYFDQRINSFDLKTIHLLASVASKDVADIVEVIPSSTAITLNIVRGADENMNVDVIFNSSLKLSQRERVFTFPLKYYLSKYSKGSFSLTTSILGNDGCFVPYSQSIEIAPHFGCGDAYFRGLMNGQPLILNIIVPSVIHSAHVTAFIETSAISDAEIELIDILGATVGNTMHVQLSKGIEEIPLDVSVLRGGTYFLRLKATDLFGRKQIVTRRFVMQR